MPVAFDSPLYLAFIGGRCFSAFVETERGSCDIAWVRRGYNAVIAAGGWSLSAGIGARLCAMRDGAPVSSSQQSVPTVRAEAMNIALISRASDLGGDELAAAAAAIQQQVSSHFSQTWDVTAVVAAFETYAPIGYAPVFIDDVANAPPGYSGYHTTSAGNPFAIVQYGPTWTLTASHEALEILADPDGMQIVPGVSPADGASPVSFIREVCDPCQNADYAYAIDGFLVSDFCTPHYFDPNAGGARLSWTGAVKTPLSVLPGGAQLWITPESEVYQRTNIDGKFAITDLGTYRPGPLGRREFARKSRGTYAHLSEAGGEEYVAQRQTARAHARESGRHRFEYFEKERKRRLRRARRAVETPGGKGD